MRFPTFVARALLVAVWGASCPVAQLAGELTAECRSGQTFLTWREAALSGVRYRIHRSTSPITGPQDLAQAELLGEVDDRSSYNPERSRVERAPRTWVVVENGAPLDMNQGLFVHTIAADTETAYYAVTSIKGGKANQTIVPGLNATLAPLVERAAPPEPVLQVRDAVREVWAHWVSDRDTPFQPALSLTPSHGFDFCLEPGQASGPRGLLLRLHAAGGTYAQGWPPRGIVPADVDVLALSDLHAGTGYTFWFGAHELFPAAPQADTRVWPFTQARVLWTLDWMSARLGAALDPERVSIGGSSLGAIGGMYLLQEAPARFSAALLRNGNYDLLAGDYLDKSVFERLYGSFALDLPTRAGLGVLERTAARFMANRAPSVDWPPIRAINGRQDTRVGWASAVSMAAGCAQTFRPAALYFDSRTHSPKGYWGALERALVQRTCQTRRDQPILCFTDSTLDDDIGDGARDSGDAIGAAGAYALHDPLTATTSEHELACDVYLRDEGALDDAPAPSGSAALTPRRTGPFVLAPGEPVSFTLSEGGALLEEHLLCADEHALVHTPPVPLSTLRRRARFERGDDLGTETVREAPTSATPEGAGPLPLGTFGLGDLTAPDETDYWRVDLAAGTEIAVEVLAARLDPAAWNLAGLAPDVRVLGPDGALEYLRQDALLWQGPAQDLDLPRWIVPADGEYRIALGTSGRGGGAYAVCVTSRSAAGLVPEQEPAGELGANDDSASAETILPGTTVAGWNSAGDRDWYSFELPEDSLVSLEMWTQRLGLALGALQRPACRLHVSDGTTSFVIDEQVFGDPAVRLLRSAGTHWVCVEGLTGEGEYLLALDARPASGASELEPNDVLDEAMSLPTGEAILGQGDVDLFAFAGEAGDRIELELFERGRFDELPVNAGLFGPLGSGAWLQQSPLLGRLATMLTASGAHVLELQAVGAYSLELAGVEHARFEAEPNDERASADLFGAGRAAGCIDPPGDVDHFAFCARLERLVLLTLHGPPGAARGSGYGSLLVPRLSIVDASGNVLASVEEASTVQARGEVDPQSCLTLAFVPRTPGPFYARIEDAVGAGGAASYYWLEIR